MNGTSSDKAALTFGFIPPNYWIAGPAADLGLILLTPLVFLLAFTVARFQGGIGALTAFGLVLAMGHHLPGMMRAYGDRALFMRFKMRFIVAPIFLVTVAAGFAYFNLHGVILLAAAWGAWHWMMQTYGFMRIYDARAGSFATTTAHLDQAMCIAWFGFAVFVGQEGFATWLRMYYDSSAPVLSGQWFEYLRQLWIVATVAITILFLVHTIRLWRHGQPPNPLKFLLMAVTFSFYYYTLTLVPIPLVAYALFEGFHDVQYLTIVWLFNRNRVEKTADVGSFTRFLFRRRGPLLLLYVAVCLGYGSFSHVSRSMSEGVLMSLALSIISASAMLHFYYDGFIWKIREKSTMESLGIDRRSSGAAGTAGVLPAWARHGSKWLLFVVPAALLGVLEVSSSRAAPVDVDRAVVDAAPGSVWAHAYLCGTLVDARQLQKALPHCQRAVELGPRSHFAHFQYARAMAQAGEAEQAIDRFRAALRVDPDMVRAHTNLAAVLQARGRLDEALGHVRRALVLRPRDARMYHNLANVLNMLGHREEAVTHYRHAVRLDPDIWKAQVGLGDVLRVQAKFPSAIEAYRQALRVESSHFSVHHGLARALASEDRFEEALGHFERVVQLKPDVAQAHYDLSRCLGSLGRREGAINSARTALKLAPAAGNSKEADHIRTWLKSIGG